ncbi:MAG: hypothetical protein GY713_09230 [Actinomycetia bacterium]|nr:hypothetical protein [Actinomycetes bacterium]
MSHECRACVKGPDQVVFRDDTDRLFLQFPGRFVGPPGHANGGAFAGALTCLARHATGDGWVGSLSVRLSRPIPLHTDLGVEITQVDDRVEMTVTSGETTIATGWVDTCATPDPLGVLSMPAERLAELVTAALPSAAASARADAAPIRHPDADMDFDTCFVCGKDHPDGLRLTLGALDNETAWRRWHPPAEFAEAGGLSPLVSTAALDCSSAALLRLDGTLQRGESVLLGTFDVDHLRAPDPEADLRLVARTSHREGRKIWSDMALVDADDGAAVISRATWIVVDPSYAAAPGPNTQNTRNTRNWAG